MSNSKKIILVGIALCSVVPLVGCGGKSNDMVDAPLSKSSDPPPPRPNKPTLSAGQAGGGGVSK